MELNSKSLQNKLTQISLRGSAAMKGRPTKFPLLWLIGAMAFLCAMPPEIASAAPIYVTYTIMGSPGDWALDFSVTNNMIGFPDQRIYFWGTTEPFNSVTGSPSEWFQDFFSGWTNAGSNLVYTESWQSDYFVGSENIFPGQTLSGFDVVDTGMTAPSSIAFFAYSTGTSIYTGGGNWNGDTTNPGFDLIALAVPEPASFALSCVGLAGLIALRRRSARAESAPLTP